jgi:hypothetical protein
MIQKSTKRLKLICLLKCYNLFEWYVFAGIRFFMIFDSDQGLTPKIPDNCPALLGEIMRMCWNKNPNQRPVSFIFVFDYEKANEKMISNTQRKDCAILCVLP